jgi:hypothetical protein
VNVEAVPSGVFTRWTLFAVALLIVVVTLGTDLAGLWPIVGVLGFLIVFRPPVLRVTDAELEAWLHGGP